jgi:hypothetical protein
MLKEDDSQVCHASYYILEYIEVFIHVLLGTFFFVNTLIPIF